MEHEYDLNDWILDERPNKENSYRQFSIGIWRGETSEYQQNSQKLPELAHDEEHDIWKKKTYNDLGSSMNLYRSENLVRHRTHSDNDPLNDVANRASIDFSVNRLSLDNVLSDITNPVDSVSNCDSPGNSSDSLKLDILSQIHENGNDRVGRSPVLEQLMNQQSDIPNCRYSPRYMKTHVHERNSSMMESLSARRQRTPLVETKQSAMDNSQTPFHSYERSYNQTADLFGDLKISESDNTLKLYGAPRGYEMSTVGKPRRAIIKSQSTHSSPGLDNLNRYGLNATQEHAHNHRLSLETKRQTTVPLLTRQRRSHQSNETLSNGMQNLESLRKIPSIRGETLSYRSTKKKYPPEYFTHADKIVFEFFKEYKLPVVLTYSQRLLAETAAGIRSQIPQTDDNPFKHLPLHCLRGVLSGSISALDFGVYWQWLSDAVTKSSLRSMMSSLLSKCPSLMSSWRHPYDDDSCRHARLIDHICHMLMVASDVGSYSPESKHGRFVNAYKRTIEADRNPAPLNHDFIAVALAPLLGHDPLLLEKVLCAIPRYKMSFSQMFGSYGTGSGEFTEPSGLAVLKDGRLAVVDTNQHRIMLFRDDKHLDLCFSSDEDAMQTDKLARLELDKQQIRAGISRNRRWNGYLMYPNRAAVDPNTGHIVLTERAPHPQVQVFTEEGRFVRRFGEGYLENPRGLCVDALSRIIVVECKIMRVTIWSGNQLQKDFVAADLGFPNSIAADARCRLFITDNEAHCVRIFSYSGQPLGSVGGPGLTNFPVAVRLRMSDGAICVFDNHNNFNMTVFTSEGALLEARESEIKHAQIHDVQLRPSDGAVIQAGKDYRVYVYKPYPFFLRGRDQRSPHLMNS